MQRQFGVFSGHSHGQSVPGPRNKWRCVEDKRRFFTKTETVQSISNLNYFSISTRDTSSWISSSDCFDFKIYSGFVFRAGHCPLSEIYLFHVTFRELALLPVHVISCHYTDPLYLQPPLPPPPRSTAGILNPLKPNGPSASTINNSTFVFYGFRTILTVISD